MNGVDKKCFDKQHSTLLVSDLSLLTPKNRLNLEIINVFIKLINNSSTTGRVISLSDIQHFTHGRLKQKSMEGKSNGIESCVIILNVMQPKNGMQPKGGYMQIHLAGRYLQILDDLLNRFYKL